MKNEEMKLLRAMDGIDDRMILDALPEQYGEKRPIRHILNARHKALWAAAIAAVVGLNIFAVMQLRGSFRTPGTSPAVYPESLPDLSAFGIDNSFELKSTGYTDDDQFDSAYRWYYEGARPTESWTLYENKDGAQLVYDRQGRLRRFFNRPEIRDLLYAGGDQEQTDFVGLPDTTGLSQTARDFMRTLFPDDPAADGISIFQNWVADDYYYSDFIELSDSSFGSIYVTEESEIQKMHISRNLGDMETEPSNSEKKRIEKAAKKLIKAVAYEGEGEITEQHYQIINGKYYGFFDVLMGESTHGQPPAYGTYYLMIDPDGVLPDSLQSGTEEYSQPDASSDGTEYPVIGGDKIMTLDDVRALAKKGSALTWSDFAPYRGRDVGSGMFIWRYDVEDFTVLVGGSGLALETAPPEPMYIYMMHNGSEDRFIDLRTDDVDAFLSAWYAVTTAPPEDSGIRTGGTTTIPETGGDREMTLDDVRTLAKKGDALTWDDFRPFLGEDVSEDGRRVWSYDAEHDFGLLVTGSPDQEKPENVMLVCYSSNLPDGTREIDIRHSDAAAFIDGCYTNYHATARGEDEPDHPDDSSAAPTPAA